MTRPSLLSPPQTSALVILRILIGWHFLYEGVLKLYSPSWTAKGYLLSATYMESFFHWMASDSMISTIDTLNITALLLVGVGLILGFKTQVASLIGIGLLLLYYFAHPPFPGYPQGPAEGSYWIINKNLIEAAALVVIFLFPTSISFGLERFFTKKEIQTQS
ncbi:thiosulfate dehydrogenase [quinone] large subunit [Algoriphagus alkaliphilus]|uniref:Thiosulfate dehydrogenase [quinone] large subunit n=1 Tax=Algoriphagus alkaliphilus TaxID=279824 RepID=A0A1G5ZFD9_9BACT|nr:DoxX family membrane protein [Algoriphagus alkaliphilus]SDA93266.1 thiosulfate dehydrogenase [quinone] large subunit [Algoriphagus alkaliphilus]